MKKIDNKWDKMLEILKFHEFMTEEYQIFNGISSPAEVRHR